MPSLVHVSVISVVALLIAFSFTRGAEYKIDVTLFDSSPLVGANSNEQFRVYLTWESRGATVSEIGRSSYTGTGEVGRVYQAPYSVDRVRVSVPDGHGLPSSTFITSKSSTNKWRRLHVNFPMSTDSSRIGVFYATTVLGSDSLTIPIVKMSETATITPNVYTKTISIGDSVTLSVASARHNNLRWVHNNGEIITAWNDLIEVTIDVARLADAGIYECFADGKRHMGQHAIMRLIVRDCPSSKYGPDCSNDCRTCWNGGICAADNGVCLCQPGFSGASCNQRLGSNKWGAEGSLFCSAKGSGNCRNTLICGPDPIGCSCVAGYTGLDCKTPCPSGWYGANCNRQCHCDSSNCDPAIGCREGSSCDDGYRDNQCQGTSTTCAEGYFGAQCDFVCHCHIGGGCSRITGVCANGICDYGWTGAETGAGTGADCQIALPYFYEGDQVTVNETGTTLTVIWNEWNRNIDYGTGPVDHYLIKYWSFNSTFTSDPFNETSTEALLTITDLLPETAYNFVVAAVRSNTLNIGPFGDEAFAVTGCGEPTLTPTITDAVQFGKDGAKLTWTIPSETDWIRCSAGLSEFIITYSIYDSVKTVRAPNISREHIFPSLTPCMVYEFKIRATNKDMEGNDSLPVDVEIVVAPEQVEVIELRDNNLFWTVPESVCEVTDYLVDVVLVHNDQCEKTNTSIARDVVDEAYMVLPQLQYFSTYEVTIQARFGNTTRGTGEANTMEFKTGESVPAGAPDNIRLTPGVGAIFPSWGQPACGQRHGNIIMYEYEFKPMKHNSDVNETTKTSANEVLMSGLVSNKTYAFRVRAYTEEGSGPFSAMYEASTCGSGPLKAFQIAAYSLAEEELTVDYLLIAITWPLSILAVIVVFAVITRLIYFKKCTFLKNTHKSGEHTSNSSARPHSTEETGHDGYAELNKSTPEQPEHYMKIDDQSLVPMTPKSMKAKKPTSKENKGSKERRESETFV